MVGDDVEIDVARLLWNEGIEEHFARHWVDYENLLAVVKSQPLIFMNLPGRAGTHVMISPDNLGRILYVSIASTSTPGIWEPVTGWESRLAGRMGKGEGWTMMKSREEMVREAEAIKDTELEIEGLIPVKARISPNLGIVYSLRFTADEMLFLRDAAKNRGMKLSEFIREVAINAASETQGQASPREEALKEARELVGAAAKALDRIAKP